MRYLQYVNCERVHPLDHCCCFDINVVDIQLYSCSWYTSGIHYYWWLIQETGPHWPIVSEESLSLAAKQGTWANVPSHIVFVIVFVYVLFSSRYDDIGCPKMVSIISCSTCYSCAIDHGISISRFEDWHQPPGPQDRKVESCYKINSNI